jgi:hypothetical protein
MAQALGIAIARAPGAAMAFNHRREGTLAPRPKYAGKQRFAAVAEIFDIVHVEFMRSGIERCSRHGGTY